ncbi:MAG: hypothetical protein ACYTEL_18535 [Planctomycetota bacterium]
MVRAALVETFSDRIRAIEGDVVKGILGPGSGQAQRTEDRRQRTDAGSGMTDDGRVAL